MVGLTSVFAGIVQVPLFDSPNVAGSGIQLDNCSYGPNFLNNGQTLGQTEQISAIIDDMPMVGGFASFHMGTPTVPGFSSGSNCSYFDGFIHYRGTSPIDITGGNCFYRQRWIPRPGILQTGVNYLSPLVDTLNSGAGGKAYISPIYPAIYRGQKAEAALYFGIGPDLVAATLRLNNGFVQGGPYGGDPGPSLWNFLFFGGHGINGANMAFNRMTVGAQSFTSFAQGMDNIAAITAGHTFGDSPAKVVWLSSIFPNITVSQEWHIDNAAIELQWTHGSFLNIPLLFVYPYGFTVSILMNGAGPTGQKYEYLVFNSDCTQYYLVKWVPQDANSALQINSNNPQFFKIDEQGIVWLQGGTPNTHISSSFSPVGIFIPVIQAPPLNPFTLPCFNTCSPVPLIET